MIIRFLLLGILFFSVPALWSYQVSEEQPEEEDLLLDYKAIDFIAPIDLPFALSGNFGEIRTNHFHSGLDIKTNSEIGYPIYAIADGYVSRIKVSEYGYGKVLYVTHPNGFTSVYAHLNEFTGETAKFVHSEHYKRQKSTFDIYPPKDFLNIKQGQIIAKSGNSGGSAGPHLHFEIRETATSKPVNPLIFNYKVPDNVAPIIKGVTIYGINDNSGVVASSTIKASQKKEFKTKIINGVHYLEDGDNIRVKRRIGFGIETYDKASLSNNTLGVYSIDTYVDGERISYFKCDKFSFYESRYVNSLIDFEEKYQENKTVSRTYRLPGNKLSMYKAMEKKGIYDFGDSTMKKHEVIIVVKDIAGNASVVKFNVKVTDEFFLYDRDRSSDEEMFYYNTQNELEAADLYARWPKYSFYKSFFFRHKVIEHHGDPLYHSRIHELDEPSVPVHKYYELKIRPERYDSNLTEKYLIARKDDKGNIKSEGGAFIDGYVYAKTRTLGTFFVAVDTLAPKLKPLNVHHGKNISNQKYIDFSVTDDFSGIDYYEGQVDGKWVLLDFDWKKKRLRYQLDEYFPAGSHNMRIIAVDDRGNESFFDVNLVR